MGVPVFASLFTLCNCNILIYSDWHSWHHVESQVNDTLATLMMCFVPFTLLLYNMVASLFADFVERCQPSRELRTTTSQAQTKIGLLVYPLGAACNMGLTLLVPATIS